MGGKNMEQEIKVGDRVVGVGVVDGKNIDGKNGTVKDNRGPRAAVEFDENISGWGDDDLGIKEGRGWGCPVENLRRITEDKPALYAVWSIHITADGLDTNAVFKQGKCVRDRAVAHCNPRDTYDATTGASWAFLRLPGMADAARRVLAEMDAPTPDEPKKRGMCLVECKPGVRVRFTGVGAHKEFPKYYPSVGVVGEVKEINCITCEAVVQWPKGSTSHDDCWGASPWMLEPADVAGADEPAPVPQPTYKPGDRVRIVDKWGDDCRQAPDGSMDKWLGKVMTIRGVYKTNGSVRWYKMVEDKKDYRGNDTPGWDWRPAAIAGKIGESRKGK